jgi:hypothetical protein
MGMSQHSRLTFHTRAWKLEKSKHGTYRHAQSRHSHPDPHHVTRSLRVTVASVPAQRVTAQTPEVSGLALLVRADGSKG